MKLSIQCLLLLVISTPVVPATPDAWEEFSQRIESTCRNLVSTGERQLHNLNVIVDKYNGVVLLAGVNRNGNEQLTVCVYDRKEKNAWLSDSVSLESLRPDFDK